MISTLSGAAAAYASTSARATGPGLAARDQPAAGGFGELVRGMLDEAVETGRQAEAVSGAAIVGQADLTDVVMAVNNAEVTLQTVVGLRDRMIEAYQEIIRMPI